MHVNLFNKLSNLSILFAEDDIGVRDKTKILLEEIFKTVYVANDGEEAYEVFDKHKPDVLLIDIKMPKMNGIDFIKKIRSINYFIPIIVLTSFKEEKFLYECIDLHLDGYLIKPIRLEHIISTMSKAIDRLSQSQQARHIILSNGVKFNQLSYEFYKQNETVVLGSKELSLMLLLIKNKNKTVRKEDIEAILYNYDMNQETYRSLIKSIRNKLGQESIITVTGIGLRVEAD